MLSICKKLLRIKNHRSGNLRKNCVIYNLLHSPNLVGYPRVQAYLKFTTWKPFKIFSNLKKFVISTSMSFPWKFGLHWLFTRGEFQVIPYPGTGFWLKEFEMAPGLWRANNFKIFENPFTIPDQILISLLSPSKFLVSCRCTVCLGWVVWWKVCDSIFGSSLMDRHDVSLIIFS